MPPSRARRRRPRRKRGFGRLGSSCGLRYVPVPARRGCERGGLAAPLWFCPSYLYECLLVPVAFLLILLCMRCFLECGVIATATAGRDKTAPRPLHAANQPRHSLVLSSPFPEKLSRYGAV